MIPTYIKIPLTALAKSPCFIEVQMTEVDAFMIFISISNKFPNEGNNEC